MSLPLTVPVPASGLADPSSKGPRELARKLRADLKKHAASRIQNGMLQRGTLPRPACVRVPILPTLYAGDKLLLFSDVEQDSARLRVRVDPLVETCVPLMCRILIVITVVTLSVDVFVDGVLATCEPAKTLPLARRYMLR